MKRLIFGAVFALAAAVTTASGQTGEPVKIKFSDKQVIEGVTVGGRPYVALSELSKAISGKVELARGLRVEGASLYASPSAAGDTAGYLATCKGKCMFTFGGGGLISSKLVRSQGKGGAEIILVPLDDLATAMGGAVHTSGANKTFSVGGLAGGAGECKKCLLILNPQGEMVNPQATRRL